MVPWIDIRSRLDHYGSICHCHQYRFERKITFWLHLINIPDIESRFLSLWHVLADCLAFGWILLLVKDSELLLKWRLRHLRSFHWIFCKGGFRNIFFFKCSTNSGESAYLTPWFWNFLLILKNWTFVKYCLQRKEKARLRSRVCKA